MSSLFIFFTFLNLLYISSFKGFTCQKLSSLNEVQILPDSCVLHDQRYDSICSFSCAGKQISGPSSAQCGIRGYWNEEVNEVSCNGSYNSNFCSSLLFTLVFLLMLFQAALQKKRWGCCKRILKWADRLLRPRRGVRSVVHQNSPPPPPKIKLHDQVSSSILGHWFHNLHCLRYK